MVPAVVGQETLSLARINPRTPKKSTMAPTRMNGHGKMREKKDLTPGVTAYSGWCVPRMTKD